MVTTVSETVTLGFPIEFSIKLSIVRECVMTEKQDSWTGEKTAIL